LTSDTDFEDQVKRAFDGEFDGERRWDDRIVALDPTQVVEGVVPTGTAVVVLGPGLDVAHALALAEALDVARPETCVVLAVKPTARLWEKALRAGVRDVLEPGAPDERVREVIGLAQAAAERRVAGVVAHQPAEVKRGRIITVLSSKGGSGKTMVSTNLAVGLAKVAPGRVVLVDLDLQFGDVAPTMQLVPQSTIADVATDGLRIDGTAVKMLLEPHPAGLYALCAPHTPVEAEDVNPAAVGHVLDLLAEDFDFVVVDTAAGLDEYTLAAVERSSDLVLVGATDVPSVKGLRKAIAALDQLGMTAQRHFLLNRADARVGLNVRDIEATVGLPVEVAVPSSRSVPVALNQGSPVLESDPHSPAARPLHELVATLAQATSPTPARSGGFWSRRRDPR
jgi:pilus assembly protein CpaE